MQTVLHPNKELTLHDGKVEVRELAWPAFFQLLCKLSASAEKLITIEEGKAKMELSAQKIGSLVASSQDLVQHLILSSTGKDEEWLNKRPLGEALQLLETALETNLNDALVERAKKIGSRLSGLFAAQPAKTTSARS